MPKNNNTHFEIKKSKNTPTTQGKNPKPAKHAYKTNARAQPSNMQAKSHQYASKSACKPGQRRLATEKFQKPKFF